MLLELCARICSTSNCLLELNLDRANPSAEQLQAIFEALLNNDASSLQIVNLYYCDALGKSRDLIEMLKLIIANQEKLKDLDLRRCGARQHPYLLPDEQQEEIRGVCLETRGALDCEIKF